MKLKIDNYNTEKCQSRVLTDGFDFLGTTIYSYKHIVPSRKKVSNYKMRLSDKLVKLTSKKLRFKTLKDINSMITGWCSAYKMCDSESLMKVFRELNDFTNDKINNLQTRRQLNKNDLLIIQKKILKFRHT